MIKKLFNHRLLPAFFLVLAFSACSRYGDDTTLSETDTIATIRDEETNFSAATKTYAIVDKINIADDPSNQIDSNKFWNLYNDPLLKAVNDNLTSLGYTKTDVNQDPTYYVNVTVIAAETSGTVWYPGWWWGYYPCYPYYYWWCYGGWYPGGAYYYSYTEGALVMEMVDLNRSEENERPTIVWLAGMTNVLSEDVSVDLPRATTNINQAFKQSPYLR